VNNDLSRYYATDITAKYCAINKRYGPKQFQVGFEESDVVTQQQNEEHLLESQYSIRWVDHDYKDQPNK
jgi:hypothetical protein